MEIIESKYIIVQVFYVGNRFQHILEHFDGFFLWNGQQQMQN